MSDLESKRICRACLLDDRYLRSLITVDPECHQPCDYCDSNEVTLSMSILAEKTDWLLRHYYCGGTYDRLNEEFEGDPLDDVLGWEISEDEIIKSDLAQMLKSMWFDWDTHEHLYGEDPHFYESMTISGEVSSRWQKMETKLRESNRFFNADAMETFDLVFSYLKQHHPSAFINFEEGTTLFRGRTFPSLDAVEAALKKPEKELGPPTSEIAKSGRMNAQGISVFYGATAKQNAISELRPPVGSFVVVSEFNLLQSVRLLDLTSLRKLTINDVSRFDPAYLERYELISFINRLSRKMVMPVVPELENSSYLITQAIADYLSTSPDYRLDGILYPSAQKPEDDEDPNIRNIVLFHGSAKVLNAEKRKHDAHVEMYEDGIYFTPTISTSHKDIFPHFSVLTKTNPLRNFLALNLDAIEIHQIKGVIYSADFTKVDHHQRDSDTGAEIKAIPDEF